MCCMYRLCSQSKDPALSLALKTGSKRDIWFIPQCPANRGLSATQKVGPFLQLFPSLGPTTGSHSSPLMSTCGRDILWPRLSPSQWPLLPDVGAGRQSPWGVHILPDPAQPADMRQLGVRNARVMGPWRPGHVEVTLNLPGFSCALGSQTSSHPASPVVL